MKLSLLQFENVNLSLFRKLLLFPILLVSVMLLSFNHTAAKTKTFTASASSITFPKSNALGVITVAIICDDGKWDDWPFKEFTSTKGKAYTTAFS